jgi:hypothetical protein
MLTSTLPTGTLSFGQWEVVAHHQVSNTPEWLVEGQLPDKAVVAGLSKLQETGQKCKCATGKE